MPINAHIDRDLTRQRIGQRDGLSFHDIKLANIVYCDGVCAGISNNCERGIQKANDCTSCLCPEDFTGQFCENVLPSTGTSKFGEIRELACGDSGTITDTVSPDGTTFKTSVLLKSPANNVITVRLTSISTAYYVDSAGNPFPQAGCPDHLEVRTNTEIIGRRKADDRERNLH
ncbi:PREDICTED: zinc metalloproteinase dpy-31-like [Priapulus caudatus]|uniref:Zinc metalloproteinase dpy-31-like n=1 Tax=Priapulus caudatus TaxID=37621 RepID=A0ABM1EXA2_PRICU|nr:PREDICTED: zinc metalloproteinase dpy-31-like [Priapulus caudatus]